MFEIFTQTHNTKPTINYNCAPSCSSVMHFGFQYYPPLAIIYYYVLYSSHPCIVVRSLLLLYLYVYKFILLWRVCNLVLCMSVGVKYSNNKKKRSKFLFHSMNTYCVVFNLTIVSTLLCLCYGLVCLILKFCVRTATMMMEYWSAWILRNLMVFGYQIM